MLKIEANRPYEIWSLLTRTRWSRYETVDDVDNEIRRQHLANHPILVLIPCDRLNQELS